MFMFLAFSSTSINPLKEKEGYTLPLQICSYGNGSRRTLCRRPYRQKQKWSSEWVEREKDGQRDDKGDACSSNLLSISLKQRLCCEKTCFCWCTRPSKHQHISTSVFIPIGSTLTFLCFKVCLDLLRLKEKTSFCNVDVTAMNITQTDL